MNKYDPFDFYEHQLKYPHLSNRKIAKHFGADESTVRRALKRIRREALRELTRLGQEMGGYEINKKPDPFPLVPPEDHEKARQKLDAPLVVYGDVVVFSDLHIPLYDAEYLNRALVDCAERGVRQCVIAGDFWHADSYGNYFPKQDAIGPEVEIPMGNKVMKLLLKHFDTIYFIKGNHDYRYVKARNYTWDFVTAMQNAFSELTVEEASRLVISNLDHCLVRRIDGWLEPDWFICHPNQYTKTPLSTARMMATIKDCNVLVGHSHHCAVGYAPNGKHVVAELGGFFDRHRTAYLRSATTFPVWQQGYCFIIDGRLHMESPGWST